MKINRFTKMNSEKLKEKIEDIVYSLEIYIEDIESWDQADLDEVLKKALEDNDVDWD